MNWSEKSRETIARVHGQLAEDTPFKDRRQAIRDAYPFGTREYWPYKAWCKAQRVYLNKYDPKVPRPPLFDTRAALSAGRDDITFPFAQEPTS